MPDVYVHRYQAWDYSSPKGAKLRWFYRVNGEPPTTEFHWRCVRFAERLWRRLDRRRRFDLRRRRRHHEQLELFARSTGDNTLRLMMPANVSPAR